MNLMDKKGHTMIIIVPIVISIIGIWFAFRDDSSYVPANDKRNLKRWR
jgi:hypothetical protein